MTFYDEYDKSLYKIGTNKGVVIYDVNPEDIGSGNLISILGQSLGNLATGKTDFSNTDTGYILGLDKGTAKLYLGTPTDYFDFDGTNVIISGTLSAGAIDIGGSDATSFHVDVDGNMWLGASTYAAAPFKVSNAGALTATGATVSGAITATSGVIGGWTINTTSIYTGTEDHSGYTANAGDITLYSDGADSSIHAKNWYIDTAGILNATSAVISGGITTTSGSSIDGSYLTAASVASASANLALRGWTYSGAFSSTDADTVAWASGTFTASDGTAYSITGSNTGNMAALTYIYLDIAVSTTAFQTTTTAATAVGNGKVLIAVAKNETARATVQVFGGSGGNILLVDHLVANSASTNEFVSNTAQLSNLVVTNAKINDLAVSKLTAGTISSKAITLAVAAGTGDSYIATGKTDFTNVDSGFILGIDDSDSDSAKFYIGNSTSYLNWTSSTMDVTAARYLESYTTGENITAGNIVCIKPSYTDYTPDNDAYVNSGSTGTNYNEVRLKTGSTYESYLSWDDSSWPIAEKILKAELILYWRQFGPADVTLRRVSGADWAEGTITWATKPAYTTDIGSVYGNEVTKTAAASGSTTFDITQLVRQWKAATINNYGIAITANATIDFESAESDNGSSVYPVIRIYSTVAGDGKIYKANCANYLLSRGIIGVATETITSGNACIIQTHGQITSVTVSDTGGRVYLSSSAGTVTTSTTNLNRIIKLGKITAANKFIWQPQDHDIIIEKIYAPLAVTSSARRFYTPTDTSYILLYVNNTTPGVEKVIRINRDTDGITGWVQADGGGGGQGATWTITQGTDYVEITSSSATGYISNLLFYT